MKAFLLIIIALLAAACSPAGNQARPITAIPAGDLTITPSLSPTIQLAAPTTTSAPSAQATATPLSSDLPVGNAREIAAATDTAMRPDIANRLLFDQKPVPIKFDEFYEGFNLRTGLILSDKLLSLDGETVQIAGYMAPPLKPELDYFVLTRIRLAFCPFCSTAADWPDDIALIYLNDDTTVATEYPVRITGRMEIGASIDQETGMVSLVRVYADDLEILQ